MRIRGSAVGREHEAHDLRRNRVLAHLWLLGGVSGLFLNSGGDAPLGLEISVAACVVGAVVYAAARRMPGSLVLPLMLLSQLVVTLGGWSNRHTEVVTGTLGSAYLWGCAFSAYYLSWRKAASYVAATLAMFGTWVWLALPTAVGFSRWLTTAVAIVALTLVIGRLRDELQWRVGVLAGEARHDPLTTLLNRRGFSEAAEGELVRAQRSRLPAAVLALDVDHFKSLNDQHGHAAGDAALVQLGALIDAQCRPHDLAGRLGGEEFAVLLPETDLPAALVVAERLRLAVHSLTAVRPLSVSIGVATTAPSGGRSTGSCPVGLDELLAAADAALYAAKHHGRDRVEAAVAAAALTS